MDISLDKQNIDRVFSDTAYYIDFYQRDYRWTDEPVLRLPGQAAITVDAAQPVAYILVFWRYLKRRYL
jgi:hypothetical protein